MNWKSILSTTLLAGTLDITAACTNAWLSSKTTPDVVLKYIASGVFGKPAFSGGYGMMAWGLFFHFIIAFACTACFFWAYPKWRFLQKSILLNAVLIGVAAWLVTTRAVIPLSQITPTPFNLSKAFVAVAILVVCIGLPVAAAAKRDFPRG